MSSKYKQSSVAGGTRFSKSPMAEVEFSRMTATPRCFTTFNAGDIVPIYCAEVLPHDTFSIDVDFVNRLSSAVIKPTMGEMQMDIFAFFVPNRIVNESWKNVQGENTSGVWSAPEVNLAPLYTSDTDVQIPVGSVADYYGFPTQAPIKAQHLKQMNDLKFKGYLCCYNEYFRDQNYQPNVPFSKLNIYNGFLDPLYSIIKPDGLGDSEDNVTIIGSAVAPNGKYAGGALAKALIDVGSPSLFATSSTFSGRVSTWNALQRPLKANKLHDAFTSVLPSPQKGSSVYFGVGDTANVTIDTVAEPIPFASGLSLKLKSNREQTVDTAFPLYVSQHFYTATVQAQRSPTEVSNPEEFVGTNIKAEADLSNATGISVNDLRTAIATQQVYEQLARGGSRYLSMLRSFFEIKAESPFSDIPVQLGHIRRSLDLYQVAQTSPSVEDSTAQGDLAGFGYTTGNGNLFTRTFLEHGYIHIFAVVRHRNVYSTMLAPDNYRRSTLDFYLPQFANIGEQPIRLATLNPFIEDEDNKVLGYQEAWWEYRYEPDRVSGQFRTGLPEESNLPSLDVWTYADPYDAGFTVVNGEWLKSNSQEVLDRTLAVTSAVTNQFIAMFAFKVDKQRPMPTYSVPGLDII